MGEPRKGGNKLHPKDRRDKNARQRDYQQRNKYRDKHRRARDALVYRHRVRAAVFSAYGDACVCCGESDNCFLTIDHINGNGSKHRRELRMRGVRFYVWLWKQGCPKDNYQILCHNCNNAKHFDPVEHCRAHPNAHLVHGSREVTIHEPNRPTFIQKTLLEAE